MSWIDINDVRIQAAIIAAGVTLLGIFLRDFFFSLLKDRRESRKNTFVIYQNYADPLLSTATKLLWRFNEIFNLEGRGSFLRGKESNTKYDDYKRKSTLYRLGSLIGWIRAYKRELSFLRIQNRRKYKSFDSAINEFESSLADGPHVETQRLKSLTRLWNIELPEDEKAIVIIGVAIEKIIKKTIFELEKNSALEISLKNQNELCLKVSNEICNFLKINPLSKEIVLETRAQAIQQIAIKESWLYRDWQEGIGDLMIHEINADARRFEVVGYRKFEKILISGSDEEQRWINRLNNVIEDLDVTGADRFDARLMQLRKTFRSIAKLVIALSKVKIGNNISSDDTIELCEKVVNEFRDDTIYLI